MNEQRSTRWAIAIEGFKSAFRVAQCCVGVSHSFDFKRYLLLLVSAALSILIIVIWYVSVPIKKLHVSASEAEAVSFCSIAIPEESKDVMIVSSVRSTVVDVRIKENELLEWCRKNNWRCRQIGGLDIESVMRNSIDDNGHSDVERVTNGYICINDIDRSVAKCIYSKYTSRATFIFAN